MLLASDNPWWLNVLTVVAGLAFGTTALVVLWLALEAVFDVWEDD